MKVSPSNTDKSDHNSARMATKQTTLAAAIVVGLAAACFLLTYNRTLNPIDEGLLLYNFQKTVGGQVPHRGSRAKGEGSGRVFVLYRHKKERRGAAKRPAGMNLSQLSKHRLLTSR